MPARVRTRRQFSLLATPSGRGQSGPLRVSFVAQPTGVTAAFAINRKVGNAVIRNKIRRRLRAILDESAEFPSGLFLIRVGNEAGKLNYEQLRRHLIDAVGRAAR